MADLRQSSAFAKYITSLGWIVEKISLFVPYGFLVQLPKLDVASCQRTGKPFSKTSCLVAEDRQLANQDFTHRSDSISQKYPCSVQKDCRYNLRKVTSDKYQVTSNNFINFYEIWKNLQEENLWIPSEKDYSSLIKCFGKMLLYNYK